MDALDRLAGIGTDLLHRVDAVLAAAGAPAGDPLWPLLRLVGALPGDALEFGLKLAPDPLRAAAAQLRAEADRFARRRDRLTADLAPGLAGVWEGSGADAFAARWQSLAGHIGDGADPATITGRLHATASYADALADWSEEVRVELAEAVARVTGSAEAVTIRRAPPTTDPTATTPPPSTEVVAAAARIGVRVLQPMADAFETVRDLEARWAPRLTELRYTEPVSEPAGSATPIVRLAL